MKLYIKYMVSTRCKMMVKDVLNKLELSIIGVDLGVAEVHEMLSKKEQEYLKVLLLEIGLELIDDKKAVLIDQIKMVIVEMLHHSEEFPKITFSNFICLKLNYDYTYLANLFSEVQGITIEQYIILQKIERIKELITYGEINITEIAYKMNYSSVAHLSNQFKKVTGFTPSHFKQLKDKKKLFVEEN